MKKLVLFLAVSFLLAMSTSAQMKICNDFSKSGLKIGVGPVLSSTDGFGGECTFVYNHALWGFSQTFTSKYAAPGISVGALALPFGKDKGRSFNPVLFTNMNASLNIYGAVHNREIGNENLEWVLSNGSGISVSAGPCVFSISAITGCRFFVSDPNHLRWDLGAKGSLLFFFSDFGGKKK